jgi:heat shock protein HtpX
MALRQEIVIRDKWINAMRTALLMGGMLFLLGVLGWFFAGTAGLVMLTGFFVFSAAMISRISPRMILRLHGARPLHGFEHPTAHRLTEWLARRAGLSHLPALYLIPGPKENALTMGTESTAAIGVTAGILRGFPDRELAGILAHEISHIKHTDTLVMGLAAMTGRFTSMLSQLGLLLLFINMPLVLVGHMVVPWPLILLLLIAPGINTLLTLSLSRTREYEADLEAARLTGDPRGLASALQRLEQGRISWWERFLFPMRREPQAPWLKTHPPTEERIRRLLKLEQPEKRIPRFVLYPGF